MRESQLTSQFALDVQSTQKLKYAAGSGEDRGALREAAVQFEALFLQSMLKSMRDATPTSDLLKSQQTDFYHSLMDKQWAQHLAGKGIGLADQLIGQIAQQRGYSAPQTATTDNLIAGIPRIQPRTLPAPSAQVDVKPSVPVEGATSLPTGGAFVEQLWPHARAVAETTGIPAELMVAQAVLETGWGEHRITHPDGRDSYNLFGIKAGENWQGDTVAVETREYLGDRSHEVTAEFRAYPSLRAAFADYASLIADNPRYANVVGARDGVAAAEAIQAAGYATDPGYAGKLIALMEQNLTPGTGR